MCHNCIYDILRTRINVSEGFLTEHFIDLNGILYKISRRIMYWRG